MANKFRPRLSGSTTVALVCATAAIMVVALWAFVLAQVAACIVDPARATNDAQREVLAKVDLHAEWAA